MTFGLLAPVYFAGCHSSAPQSAQPAPTSPPAAQPTIIPTPAPPRIIATPAPLIKQPIAIPNPQRPKVNGYDLLVQAGKNLQPELPPNSSIALQKAHVAKNAGALQLMKKALQLPIVAPLQRSLMGTTMYHAQLRSLGRAATERARVQADAGDFNAATQSALDAIEIGAVIQNGAVHMNMLVGIAIEQIGRTELAHWRKNLTATQAMRAAQRLERIEAAHTELMAIESEEKWLALASLRGIFQDAEWKKFRAGQPNSWSRAFKTDGWEKQLRKTSDAQIEANLVAKLDADIARAQEPYAPNLLRLPDAADPLSALLAGSANLARMRLNYEKNRAENRLLLTALALQAFSKATGQYPQSLNQLVPQFLKGVPLDPFAPNAPLIYQKQGQKFMLYSVGPDGSDDGGVPMEPEGGSTLGTEKANGDLVAGESN